MTTATEGAGRAVRARSRTFGPSSAGPARPLAASFVLAFLALGFVLGVGTVYAAAYWTKRRYAHELALVNLLIESCRGNLPADTANACWSTVDKAMRSTIDEAVRTIETEGAER